MEPLSSTHRFPLAVSEWLLMMDPRLLYFRLGFLLLRRHFGRHVSSLYCNSSNWMQSLVLGTTDVVDEALRQ